MTEGNETTLGTRGLPYGTKAAEEMIAERARKLEGRGYPDARSAAIGQLAAEGNLRTEREVSARDIYLGDPARREIAAEQRQQAQQGQARLGRDKAEAERRGITLSELMNEKAQRGEVTL